MSSFKPPTPPVLPSPPDPLAAPPGAPPAPGPLAPPAAPPPAAPPPAAPAPPPPAAPAPPGPPRPLAAPPPPDPAPFPPPPWPSEPPSLSDVLGGLHLSPFDGPPLALPLVAGEPQPLPAELLAPTQQPWIPDPPAPDAEQALPARGLRGVVPGVSTVDDVLRAFGRDCQINQHASGEVFSINFNTDQAGRSLTGSAAVERRPSDCEFKRGTLAKMSFGVYQRNVRTLGGLHRGSTLSEVLAALGPEYDYECADGSTLAAYRWPALGLFFWIDRAEARTNSFRLETPDLARRWSNPSPARPPLPLAADTPAEPALLPRPRSLASLGPALALPPQGGLISLHSAGLRSCGARLAEGLRRHAGAGWELTVGLADQALFSLAIDPSAAPPQGYRLTIEPSGVRLLGADDAGLFHGTSTLLQLLASGGATLPSVRIDDAPDMPVRGALIDLSGGRVLTMAALRELVDRLAGWKLNQLQLCLDGAFAFRASSGPDSAQALVAAGDLLELDAYCKERHIDLVPCVESASWGEARLDELLPALSTGLVNLGGVHESVKRPWGRRDDAEGERAQLALAQGQAACARHGRSVMAWADSASPWPLAALPPGAVALATGHEASFDFEAAAATLSRAGVPFYVCPGTSGWHSLAGRTSNALTNIRRAAAASRGALGLLVADWAGDPAWQHTAVRYAPLAYAAAVSWGREANEGIDLAATLDALVFDERAGVAGATALKLGEVYQRPGFCPEGGSLLFWALRRPLGWLRELWARAGQPMPDDARLRAGLREALDEAQALAEALGSARPQGEEGQRSRRELAHTAAMLSYAARRALADLGDTAASEDELRSEKLALVAEMAWCWLGRHRRAGLPDEIANSLPGRAGRMR